MIFIFKKKSNAKQGFPGGSEGKESTCNAADAGGAHIPSPGWEDPLEEGMTTHSSILAWRIPWTEKPGGLQSIESQTDTTEAIEYTRTRHSKFVQLLLSADTVRICTERYVCTLHQHKAMPADSITRACKHPSLCSKVYTVKCEKTVTKFFRPQLEAGKAENRGKGFKLGAEKWPRPSNHRDAWRVHAQTREATRGRLDLPKCPPKTAMQSEVYIFILILSTGGSEDWRHQSRLCPQCSQSFHTWKYLLLSVGIVDLRKT